METQKGEIVLYIYHIKGNKNENKNENGDSGKIPAEDTPKQQAKLLSSALLARAASEVFVFLGVEKTGGYAFFSSFGVELEIQAHFCGSHGAGPVFAAVADGKVEPGAVGEVGLAMAAFLCAPGWGGRLAGDE